MKQPKQLKPLSKFLSLVLRHRPEVINLELDDQGWTSVEALLGKMQAYGKQIDFPLLKEIVATNNKQRFAFNPDQTRIRANQGHSIELNLGYSPKTPPEFLYHGTAQRFMNSIMQQGLQKRKRHHVHLSPNRETALQVGQRHGKPVILIIQSELMHKDGFAFYESDNGVWLTNHVPVDYFEQE